MQSSKKGISLVALVLTIILLIILASAIVISSGDNVNDARLSAFANEITQIQDAVDSYYILNNSLPVIEEKIAYEEVKGLIDVNYIDDFEEEVSLNLDTDAEFYKIDLSLIEIQNSNEIDIDEKSFVVSYPNINVYSLNVTEINGVGYFSLTSKVVGVVEFNDNKTILNSNTNITNGVNLVVNSNTSRNTNELGISVSISNFIQETDSVYLEIFGVEGQKKVSSDKAISFEFDNLEELVSKSILEETLTSEQISTFNNSNEKNINIVVNRNDSEIARQNLDMSNFDIIKPVVSLEDNKQYDKMRVVRISAFDSNSNIKEIRYDYLEKLDASNNTVYYYDEVSSFDEKYMREKSKVISSENIIDGFVDIKIPSDVVTMCVIALDDAGNISDILTINVQ